MPNRTVQSQEELELLKMMKWYIVGGQTATMFNKPTPLFFVEVYYVGNALGNSIEKTRIIRKDTNEELTVRNKVLINTKIDAYLKLKTRIDEGADVSNLTELLTYIEKHYPEHLI